MSLDIDKVIYNIKSLEKEENEGKNIEPMILVLSGALNPVHV